LARSSPATPARPAPARRLPRAPRPLGPALRARTGVGSFPRVVSPSGSARSRARGVPEAGHRLVDQIADFLRALPALPVPRGDSPDAIRALLPAGSLPEEGRPEGELLDEAARLLFDHSLFNGHPRFWGYVTSSAAPLGALGDLLAAAVNPNLGAFGLSP